MNHPYTPVEIEEIRFASDKESARKAYCRTLEKLFEFEHTAIKLAKELYRYDVKVAWERYLLTLNGRD